MYRAELHALVDAAIDSIRCDECRDIFIEVMGAHAIKHAGTHNAKDIGEKVTAGELTPAAAYDELSACMRPLYAATGDDISEEQNAQIRSAFLRLANSDLN